MSAGTVSEDAVPLGVAYEGSQGPGLAPRDREGLTYEDAALLPLMTVTKYDPKKQNSGHQG